MRWGVNFKGLWRRVLLEEKSIVMDGNGWGVKGNSSYPTSKKMTINYVELKQWSMSIINTLFLLITVFHWSRQKYISSDMYRNQACSFKPMDSCKYFWVPVFIHSNDDLIDITRINIGMHGTGTKKIELEEDGICFFEGNRDMYSTRYAVRIVFGLYIHII